MNPVHSRRDDDQIQGPFERNWQTPVGMMKKYRGLQSDEESDENYRWDAEHRHCQRKKSNGKNHLAEMESRGSAYVEIKIGVMNIMKSPEKRHHVHRPMPPPIGVVHQNKRRDHRRPRWKMNPIQ